MSILQPTNLYGRAVQLLVNTDASDLTTTPLSRVDVSFEGFAGDTHTGLTRESCSRVRLQYKVGTRIRNTRQISIVSSAEMTIIAAAMGLPGIDAESIGANLVIDGIPELSALPPSSRLIFETGVSLVIDMENEPCRFPGEIIEQGQSGATQKFAIAAKGLRGVTAWVEKEGVIKIDDRCRVHTPKARPYPHGGIES